MSVVTSQKNPIKSVISVDKQWLFSHVRIRGYCGITVGLSASTFAYLMRWPVFRLIWLKLTFSESEVAGYKATGQVTRERRRKPFQLARGCVYRKPYPTMF